MPATREQIVDALRPVQDPELHRSIVDLGMVRDVTPAADGSVGDPRRPHRARVPAEERDPQPRRHAPSLALDGVTGVAVDFTVMTDQEREDLRSSLHGDGGAPTPATPTARPQGHAEGREIPFAQPGSRTRPLLISSGKGGVGKSSVTTNLAVALAARGHSVGIVDADIYGFSIPRMLGADRDPVAIDQMLLPPEAWGVRCISIGYFVPDGQAVVWRGPMLHKALEQFLTDVYWDEPDFLLVDMPPGTGDIAISLSQYLPRGEVYVVTTPQPAAQKVARLSAAMAAKVNLQVRGVIENMSWFTGDDGKRYEIFGSGGGAELAAELDVPLLAQLPLVPGAAGRRRHRAARSPPSTPTARRAGRSTASPSRSPSRCARRRCSAPSSSSSERRRDHGPPLPLRADGRRGPRRPARRAAGRARQRRRPGRGPPPRRTRPARAVRRRPAHRAHRARRAPTSSASTAWRCARCATTRTTSPRRSTSR